MLHVDDAEGVRDLDAVRALIREFVAWHRRTHVEDLARIDAYFDPVAFEAELGGSRRGTMPRPTGVYC